MHTKTIAIVIIIWTMLSASVAAEASKEQSRFYIWSFSTENQEVVERLADRLTEDFEEALSDEGCVPLLERRRFMSIVEHRDSNRQIMELEGLPVGSIEELKSKQATAVILGSVFDDLEDGRVRVRVSAYSFDGSVIARESVRFLRGLRDDQESREQAMRELAQDLCTELTLGFFNQSPAREASVPEPPTETGRYGNYIAVMEIEARKEPKDLGGETVFRIPAGSRVVVLTEPDRYGWVRILGPNRAEGFANMSRLRLPGEPVDITPTSIPVRDLEASWIYRATDGEGSWRHIWFWESTDDTGRYNGQSTLFHRRGGRFQPSSTTPITWDIDEDRSTIRMELWTEVTDKGFRQKWNVRWFVKDWDADRGRMTLVEQFENFQKVTFAEAFRCSQVPQDLSKYCAVSRSRFTQ